MESIQEQTPIQDKEEKENVAEEIVPYVFTQNYLTEKVLNYEPCERDLFIKNEKINDY